IVIPDRNVSFLAWLDGSDFVFEKQLACGPCGIGAQRSVDVYCFRRPKGMSAVHALERLAFDRSPDSVARGIRSHEIVGTSRPSDAFREPGLEWLQALR